MKHYLVILFAIICTAGTSRIYDGESATPGQFPFMASINYYVVPLCNGVIVAPNWILTAVSCIDPALQVYVGSNTYADSIEYAFLETIIHEEYDETTKKNDIALIRINGTLEYGDAIQQVELGVEPAENATCTMMGWGLTETEDNPPLQYGDTTVISFELCQELAASSPNSLYLGAGQICVRSGPGKGACYYDNGGPLICDGKVSGILSYGFGECGGELPDVYGSVETYSDWILSHIQA